MTKNYYEILSLKRDSSDQQIAQNYQRMVLRWHPKFAKQDQKTAYYHFSEISQAYQVLSDPIKRAFYDKYGWDKLKEGLFAQGQLKGGYRFANNPDQIFQKFFHSNNVFAKVFDKQLTQRGSLFSHAFGALNYKDTAKYEDLIVNVPCTLNQLYMGVAKSIKFNRKVLNPDGRTTSLVQNQKILDIKPGFSKQTVITFQKEGHESIHRTKSNLIFKIQELPDKNYQRAHDDLIYNFDITLAQVIQCKPIEVFTLDNRKIKISIDEIVTPRTLKQVLREGMPSKNGKGNLYIKFNIQFPKQLSQEKRNQLRKLLV